MIPDAVLATSEAKFAEIAVLAIPDVRHWTGEGKHRFGT